MISAVYIRTYVSRLRTEIHLYHTRGKERNPEILRNTRESLGILENSGLCTFPKAEQKCPILGKNSQNRTKKFRFWENSQNRTKLFCFGKKFYGI